MGRDKAFVEVDGAAMAARVGAALAAAGATSVRTIGGRAGDIADAFPGEGPLGGVITALRAADGVVVVTAPCDMPWLTADALRAVIDALAAAAEAHAAYAAAAHLVAAWRPSVRPPLEALFAAGERSPKRALRALDAIAVELPAGRWSADVDSPADLPES